MYYFIYMWRIFMSSSVGLSYRLNSEANTQNHLRLSDKVKLAAITIGQICYGALAGIANESVTLFGGGIIVAGGDPVRFERIEEPKFSNQTERVINQGFSLNLRDYKDPERQQSAIKLAKPNLKKVKEDFARGGYEEVRGILEEVLENQSNQIQENILYSSGQGLRNTIPDLYFAFQNKIFEPNGEKITTSYDKENRQTIVRMDGVFYDADKYTDPDNRDRVTGALKIKGMPVSTTTVFKWDTADVELIYSVKNKSIFSR